MKNTTVAVTLVIIVVAILYIIDSVYADVACNTVGVLCTCGLEQSQSEYICDGGDPESGDWLEYVHCIINPGGLGDPCAIIHAIIVEHDGTFYTIKIECECN